MAETLSIGFSEEDCQSSHAETDFLAEVGNLIRGRTQVALARIRHLLAGRIEENQKFLILCEEKIKAEQEEQDARGMLLLTKLHAEIAAEGQQLFHDLDVISAVPEGGRPQSGATVNRSSRRTKPPIIVDGELT